MSFTWDAVSAIMQQLLKAIPLEGDEEERFSSCYEAIKARLQQSMGVPVKHRALLALSLFAIAYENALGRKLDTKYLGTISGSLDYSGALGKPLRYVPSRGILGNGIRAVRRAICDHPGVSERTRHMPVDDANLDDASFISMAREGRIESCCTSCKAVFSAKPVHFTMGDILRLIPPANDPPGGIALKELVAALEARNIIRPLPNLDPRKHASARYTAIKPLLDKLTFRGLVVLSGGNRNKRLTITKKGASLMESSG